MEIESKMRKKQIGKGIQLKAGMRHARRKQRRVQRLSLLQNRSGAKLHAVFNVINALRKTAIRSADDKHAFFLNTQKERALLRRIDRQRRARGRSRRHLAVGF